MRAMWLDRREWERPTPKDLRSDYRVCSASRCSPAAIQSDHNSPLDYISAASRRPGLNNEQYILETITKINFLADLSLGWAILPLLRGQQG